MPLIDTIIIDHNTRIGIWENTESDYYFLNALKLNEQEKARYSEMKLHRQREWLSSRYLLHVLTGEATRSMVIKDSDGKPALEGSTQHISISHSKNRVAVLISDRRCGIDIQQEQDKINRIQHKFITDHEHEAIESHNSSNYYHIFWGAKESMYKAYGLRELDFKKHLYLYPFKYFQDKIECVGWVRKDGIEQDYTIYTDKYDDYFLVYCLLSE